MDCLTFTSPSVPSLYSLCRKEIVNSNDIYEDEIYGLSYAFGVNYEELMFSSWLNRFGRLDQDLNTPNDSSLETFNRLALEHGHDQLNLARLEERYCGLTFYEYYAQSTLPWQRDDSIDVVRFLQVLYMRFERIAFTGDWIIDMSCLYDFVERLHYRLRYQPSIYSNVCEQCNDLDYYGQCDEAPCRMIRERGFLFVVQLYCAHMWMDSSSFSQLSNQLYGWSDSRLFIGPDGRTIDTMTWKEITPEVGQMNALDEPNEEIWFPPFDNDENHQNDDEDQPPPQAQAILEPILEPPILEAEPSGVFEDIEEELARPTNLEYHLEKTRQLLNKEQKKLTKIQEAKKLRKQERLYACKIRRCAYKISRALERDEKYAEPSGCIDLVSRSLTGITYAAKSFLTLIGLKKADTRITDQWLAIAITAASNPSPSGIISVFAQLLNLFGISMSNAIAMIYSAVERLVKEGWSKIKSQFGSAQQSPEPLSAEATPSGLTEIVNSLGEKVTNFTEWLEQFGDDHMDKLPMLMTAIAGSALTMAAFILGTKPSNTKVKSNNWDRMINAAQNIAKMKSGIYSFGTMLKDFCKFTEGFIKRSLLSSKEDHLVQCIKDVDFEDDPERGLVKEKFFEYYEYIVNPVNSQKVMSSNVWRLRLQYVDSMLTKTLLFLGNQESSHEQRSLTFTFTNMQRAIQQISGPAFRTNVDEMMRFRPFVFYFSGGAGIGKTVFQTRFANNIMEILGRDARYQVPADKSSRYLSVNFSDQYLTGYKGQYCLLIDDLFQDRDGAIEGTSSALQFINWVSNCHYSTKQADLNSKGTLFTSHMIVASSNLDSPTCDSIRCGDALIRRLDYQVRFVKDDTREPDPGLGYKRVRLELHQPKQQKNGAWKIVHVKDFKDSEELLVDAIVAYKRHFEKEMYLQEISNPNTEMLDRVASKVVQLAQQSQGYASGKREAIPSAILESITESDFENEEELFGSQEQSCFAKWFPWIHSLFCERLPAHIKPLSDIYAEIHTQYHEAMRDFLLEPVFLQSVEYWNHQNVKLENFAETQCNSLHDMKLLLLYFGYIQYKNSSFSVLIDNDVPELEYGPSKKFLRPGSCLDRAARLLIDLHKESAKATYARHYAFEEAPIIHPHIWRRHEFTMRKRLSTFFAHPGWQALKNLTIAAALVSGAIYLFKRRTLKTEDIEPTAGSYDSSVPQRVSRLRARNIRNAFASGDIVSDSDDPMLSTITDVLTSKQSIVRICFQLPNGNQRYSQNAVRIKGNAILTNHHFFSFLKEYYPDSTPMFTVLVPSGSAVKRVEEYYSDDFLCRIPGKDLVVYKLSPTTPSARDITHYFPSCEFPQPETTCFRILKAPVRDSLSPTVVDSNKLVRFMQTGGIYSTKETKYEMSDCWYSDLTTEKGDSGSLLLARNRRLPHKIIGIQSAVGTRGGTWFEAVCKEELDEACRILEVGDSTMPNFDEVTASTGVDVGAFSAPGIGKESLVPVGRFPNRKIVPSARKTNLIPSLIHNPLTSKMQPSVLSPKDPRLEVEVSNLFAHNTAGYDEHYGPVDRVVLDEATEDLADYLKTAYHTDSIVPRLLNEDEMVNGIPGVLNPLGMHTSPGYPFVLERKDKKQKGKYEWFDLERELDDGRKVYTMKSQIRERVEQREAAAKQGQRLADSIGYMCLKDEKRKLEKIRQGKTRVFICLPMDYNLLIRKYFGAFISAQHLKAGRVGIASCVGINPIDAWPSIYRELCSVNRKWEDFDYANWDQSLHPDFFSSYARIVSRFYGDALDSEEHKVRVVLMDELCWTFLQMGPGLVLKSGGQCSGCAITAEINCTIHELLMLYSYKLFHKRRGEAKCMIDFSENVAIKVYGDDILFAAKPEELFSGAEHRKIAEELGMRITTAQKDLNFREKLPSECTFLKRSFVFDERFKKISCPMDKLVVEEIAQWIHQSDDPLEATLVNVNASLLEAFLLGRSYYENLREQYKHKLTKIDTITANRIEPYSTFLNQYVTGKFSVFMLTERENV